MLGRFFLDCNRGFSPLKIKKLTQEYGTNILIGVDPGLTDEPDEDALLSIKAIKSSGTKLHVYLVGPGMMSWSADERKQIEFFAKSIGLNTKQKDWHKKWTTIGWKKKNLQQFKYYHEQFGAYSCEIDNIDSSYIENDPELTVKFFEELKKDLTDNNIPTKLMMKNLSEEQLEAVIEAKFQLDFLCEFAMFEKGTGNPKKQIELCKKLDVQAITPINGITRTEEYGVKSDGVEYSV